MRIAHLSDIHFGGENKGAVAAAFDRLAAEPPDLTVISGDLTVAGAAAEYAAAGEWTGGLAARGCRLLMLPGNHDTPTFDIPVRLTAPWGRWRRAFGPSDGVTFDAPGLAVIGFNTARGVQPRLNWSKGAVDRRQVRHAAARLASAPAGALRVAACHHPLVELPDGPMSGRVWGGAHAAQALAEAKADLVLTGHIHAPFAMAYPYGDGQTLAVGASTLSVRERGAPAGYNLIEADGPEIRVTALGWGGHAFAPWRSWAFARRAA
jgi:3',5'-cyclic AMP phosphodiesterase CpdA